MLRNHYLWRMSISLDSRRVLIWHLGNKVLALHRGGLCLRYNLFGLYITVHVSSGMALIKRISSTYWICVFCVSRPSCRCLRPCTAIPYPRHEGGQLSLRSYSIMYPNKDCYVSSKTDMTNTVCVFHNLLTGRMSLIHLTSLWLELT